MHKDDTIPPSGSLSEVIFPSPPRMFRAKYFASAAIVPFKVRGKINYKDIDILTHSSTRLVIGIQEPYKADNIQRPSRYQTSRGSNHPTTHIFQMHSLLMNIIVFTYMKESLLFRCSVCFLTLVGR